MASSDSLSPISEPPDLGNWFSSYVYESPILDADIDSCVFKESELEKEAFGIEDTNSMEKEDESWEIRKLESKNELDVAQRRTSNRVVECRDYVAGINNPNSEGNEWIDMARDIAVAKILPSGMLSDQCLEEKAPPKHYYRSSAQDFERSKLRYKIPEDPEFTSSNINKGKNNRKLSELLICNEKIHDDVTSDIHLDAILDETTSLKNVKKHKENERNICQENGFISTRKKPRQYDENFQHRPEQEKCGNLGYVKEVMSTNKQNDGSAKRKVLSETTNKLQSCDTFEIAGKWRCPQRSKPNLGPPLKQLRLEEWVRRV